MNNFQNHQLILIDEDYRHASFAPEKTINRIDSQDYGWDGGKPNKELRTIDMSYLNNLKERNQADF